MTTVQEKSSRKSLGRPDFETDPETRGLVMDIFGFYGRCSQCDEENVLADGSKRAACLGLVCGPIDDEDHGEESSSISLERKTA